MTTIASQITSLTIIYSTVYSGADQSKHQSSASLAFVWGIHRGPVNSPHKWPVTRKMFPFDDVIMRHIDLGMAIGDPQLKKLHILQINMCISNVVLSKLIYMYINNLESRYCLIYTQALEYNTSDGGVDK